MLDPTHIYYILIGALSLISLGLMIVPINNKHLEGYALSVRLLAISFIVMSACCAFQRLIPRQICGIWFLIICNLELHLLALSHLNMINPQRVNKRFVMRSLAPMYACMFVYMFVLMLFPYQRVLTYEAYLTREVILYPEFCARWVWKNVLFINALHYIGVFFREDKMYQLRAKNFFSEQSMKSHYLIKMSFYIAMVMLIITLLICYTLDERLYTEFNIVRILLYIIMGAIFIQYPLIFKEIEPLLYSQQNKEEIAATIAADPDEMSAEWKEIRQKIVEEKKYLVPHITMPDMALFYGVTRSTFSSMINQNEHMNFNQFINKLRIEEAKKILDADPSTKLMIVGHMVGYTEQSNFTRNFKNVTGMSPREYLEEKGR